MTKHDTFYQIALLARPLQREMEAAVAAMLSGASITVRTRAMLEVLGGIGPATVPQVARDMGIRRQYVQIMMNEAEAGGLVRSRDNPAHERSALFELTRPGKDVLAGLERAERRVIESLVDNLTRDEVEKTRHVIGHMLQGFRDLNASLGN